MLCKNIHFIWINRAGKPLPEKYCGFIQKWRDLYPEFEVKLWGNDSVAGLKDEAVLEAWASSDYDEANVTNRMRLLIVNLFGGIYADVDTEPIKRMVEVIQDSDKLVIGATQTIRAGLPTVDTNLFYSPPDNPVLVSTLASIPRCSGSYGVNRYFVEKHRSNITICPVEYFQGCRVTPKTYSLHWPHRLGSWMLTKHAPSTRTP